MPRLFFLHFNATEWETRLVWTACNVVEHVAEASLLSFAVASALRQKESRHSPSLAWTGTGLKLRRPNIGRGVIDPESQRSSETDKIRGVLLS